MALERRKGGKETVVCNIISTEQGRNRRSHPRRRARTRALAVSLRRLTFHFPYVFFFFFSVFPQRCECVRVCVRQLVKGDEMCVSARHSDGRGGGGRPSFSSEPFPRPPHRAPSKSTSLATKKRGGDSEVQGKNAYGYARTVYARYRPTHRVVEQSQVAVTSTYLERRPRARAASSDAHSWILSVAAARECIAEE